MQKSVLLIISLYSSFLCGQATYTNTSPDRDYLAGMFLTERDILYAGYESFQSYLGRSVMQYEPDHDLQRTHAELGAALNALAVDAPGAEYRVLQFIRLNRSDPVASSAQVEIAHYYFSRHQYKKAIEFYSSLRMKDVSPAERSEVRFKQGYAHFVKKQFDDAALAFEEVSEVKNDYYYPTNYYLAMCYFMEGQFESAVAGFQKVASSRKYKQYVPYYTALIYFGLGRYEDVLAYAVPEMAADKLYNADEIGHLIGQSYFELGDYAGAVPYLEAYNATQAKMRPGDFYQLAFSQYSIGACAKATENFKQIANLENSIGQRANFYIADCTLKFGEYQMARNAFRSVSRMNYDMALREEALFNFGKLSAQLDYDREAIQTLGAIPRSSPHYNESREILNDVFHLTRDYVTALDALDEMDQASSLNPPLQRQYQRLAVLRGIQLMSDNDLAEASKMFVRSEKYPLSQDYTTQALYWQAELAHRGGDYQQSIELFDAYFTHLRSAREVPKESSGGLAHYAQGYNYLYLEQYGTALRHFTDAAKNVGRLSEPIYNEQIKPDAQVRAGDCLFKLNRYTEAITWYDEAIAGRNEGLMLYAMYQKAVLKGLTDNPFEKVFILDEITSLHPESQYVDNALFQLGVTHLELESPDKAIRSFENLVDHYPASEEYNPALLRLGLISFNNGDLTSAASYYKRVFEHDPSSLEAQESLSALEEIYVRELATPEAYFAFVETVPGFEVSAVRRDSISYRTAEIQYENGQYDRAVEGFNAYLAGFPNGISQVKALYYRAECYAILERFTDALESYDAVVEHGTGPFYPRALAKAGSISYHARQNFYLSYEYFDKLSQIISDKAQLSEAYRYMMRSAYRTERWDEVLLSGRKVLVASDVLEEEIAETEYCVATAYYRTGKVDDAIVHYNRVTQTSDNQTTAESRYMLAKIYYDRQQIDLAEQMCHNANSANSNYPVWIARGLLLLSDIYLAKQDLFNAKAPLEALIDNIEGEVELVTEAQTKLDSIGRLEEEQSRLKASTDTLEMTKNNNDDDR